MRGEHLENKRRTFGEHRADTVYDIRHFRLLDGHGQKYTTTALEAILDVSGTA